MSQLNLFNNFIMDHSLTLINRYLKSSSIIVKKTNTEDNPEYTIDFKSLKNFMIDNRFVNELIKKIKLDLIKNNLNNSKINYNITKILNDSEIELCILKTKSILNIENEIDIVSYKLSYISNKLNQCLLTEKNLNKINPENIINEQSNTNSIIIKENSIIQDSLKWVIIASIIVGLFLIIYYLIKKNNSSIDNLSNLNNKYLTNSYEDSSPTSIVDLGSTLKF